jgi:type IV pilus assembly protein PilM
MSSLLSVREAPAPGVAVEIAAGHVSAAALDYRGREPVVSAHATEWLSPQAVTPSLTGVNARDRAGVVGAVARVLEKVGAPRRVGLIVPDVVAKVSLVKFEHVPPRAQDLEQLVRWQVRKTAPFPIEEAQVSFVPGLPGADGHEFIVSVARREVVAEYEGICGDAGTHAGLVDLSTFNVINAVLAGGATPASDWLLVNIAADSASIAIMRGPHLILFRNRAADTEGTLADLVHQTAMYYEDRLKGGGFARVVLAGAASAGSAQAADVERLRRSLEERVAMAVEPIDPRTAAGLTDRITATPALLDTLAPLVGLLLRDRDGNAASV